MRYASRCGVAWCSVLQRQLAKVITGLQDSHLRPQIILKDGAEAFPCPQWLLFVWRYLPRVASRSRDRSDRSTPSRWSWERTTRSRLSFLALRHIFF